MLGSLPDAEADCGADPLDEQRHPDEDADREQGLRRPVLGDRPGDRGSDHRAQEQARQEPGQRQSDPTQSAP